MEQLSLTAGKEKENVVQILTDLMEHNREFQIMITVPARAAGEENSLEFVQAKEVPIRDSDVSQGHGYARLDHKDVVSGNCEKV